MSTIEKLFLQIFERKDRIIDQLQQQADSYNQQLASRLLIDGITPPPWLLSPNSNSHSSDPNELEKEKIISKLLLRPPRDSTQYSAGGGSLYYRPVVAGGNINKQLPTAMCVETNAPNKAMNSSNETIVTHECHNNDTVCILNKVPELDNSASFQRSKSRQKARELRNSGKTTDKRCSSNENRTRFCFTGDSKCKEDFNQVIEDIHPPDVAKWNNVSGETSMVEDGKGEKGNDGTRNSGGLAKSTSSYEIPSLENKHDKIKSTSDTEELVGIVVEPTVDSMPHGTKSQNKLFTGRITRSRSSSQQNDGINKSSKLGISVSCNPSALPHSVGAFTGRITRSRSSSQQNGGINKSSKLGISVSCNPKGGGVLSHSVGALVDTLNFSNNLSDSVKTSQVVKDINAQAQAICSNEGVLKPVISSYMDKKESSLEQSADCCVNVKPMQLNFDEVSEYDLNENCSSSSKKRKLDGLSGKERSPSKECASLADHNSSCKFFEQQLAKADVMSSSPKTTRTHSHNNGGVHAKAEMNKTESDTNLDDVNETCEVVLCPKEVDKQQLAKADVMSSSPKTTRTHSHNNGGVHAKAKMNKTGSDTYVDYINETCEVVLCCKEVDKQQLAKADVMSSSPKTTRTHSHNNGRVHAKAEMNKSVDDINETCEVVLCPKEVDNNLDEEEHPEKSRLDEDRASALNMQTEEGDFDHKDMERSSDVYIPVSNIKSPLTTSLTKQGIDGFEDCLDEKVNKPEVDLDPSKSATNAKLSNIQLNSAKVNTWPLNQQKNVEGQPNCFSDSRNIRVHLQRDAVQCNLETPENCLNLLKGSPPPLSSEKIQLTRSNGMQSCDKNLHNEMISNLSEGTEPILEIQAAEKIVTEEENDTTKTDTLKLSESTSVLNLIKNTTGVGPTSSIINGDVAVTDNDNVEINLPKWVSSYGSVPSSQNDDKATVVSDEITPVYEGFIIDEEMNNVNITNTECAIDLNTQELPSTTIERASIIEQFCKSASIQTPLSQFYEIMEDSRKHLEANDSGITNFDPVFPPLHKVEYATPFYWQSKNLYSSPVGKLWERSTSSSGSSEVQLSSNPDLTCFPIEEDHNEENDEFQENINPVVESENPSRVSIEMEVEKRESDDDMAVEIQHENNVSMSSMKYPERYSLNSVSVEVSVPRTRDKVKHKAKVHHGIKVSRYEEGNCNSSIATRASSRGNVSVSSKHKSGMRNGISRLSQKDAKRNNIVSNVTSFIPMVQQKQATTVCTGKRDIKVKSLEAAEAAKRREVEKENERKQKKEAFERAKENAKQLELNLKKQEELKKKEAETTAARKRQREEEERKRLAKISKKRKLVAEAHKNQKLKYEKPNQVKNAAMAGNKKKSENRKQIKNADESSFQKQEMELRTEKTLASAVKQVTGPENHDASNDGNEKDKATSGVENSPAKVLPVNLTGQENSYDISPYCSDDEDDDEDDFTTNKFVPSWASKTRVSMVLPLQQKLDPKSIFPLDSFCSMDEVLLPRRLQAR